LQVLKAGGSWDGCDVGMHGKSLQRWLGFWAVDVWAMEVWLKIQCNGHVGRRWAATTKGVGLLDILLKQRIKAEVGTKPGKVICIGKAGVIAMLDNHIPAHKSHLQVED
jgi:hypothetical protein